MDLWIQVGTSVLGLAGHPSRWMLGLSSPAWGPDALGAAHLRFPNINSAIYLSHFLDFRNKTKKALEKAQVETGDGQQESAGSGRPAPAPAPRGAHGTCRRPAALATAGAGAPKPGGQPPAGRCAS